MSADVTVVGGGVIGCAIAYELTKRGGARVVVFERDQPGCGASGAAAGVLAYASSRAPGGVLFQLKRAGALAFPELSAALLEDCGIDVEYRSAGLIDLAFSPAEAYALERHVARRRAQGFDVELLDADTLRELEPDVSDRVERAALFRDDAAINNVRLVAALRAVAERRGAEFHTGVPIDAIERTRERVDAVRSGSRSWTVGHLIVAGGAWSRGIGEMLGVKVPVRPDRGEMLALQAPGLLRRPLSWNDGYLVPRSNGEVLVGSTTTRNTWDTTVSARSLATLTARAATMVPALREAAVVRTWAGLRPLSTLRRPVIGHLPGYTNVIIATGHHRTGIVMAPITARLVAELLRTNETSLSLQPFKFRTG